MLTQTLNTQAINTQVRGKIAPAHPVSDPFGAITGHVGLVATEFSYRKDEEIYGEDEPAEYVYQVVSGAVRSYKLPGRSCRATVSGCITWTHNRSLNRRCVASPA